LFSFLNIKSDATGLFEFDLKIPVRSSDNFWINHSLYNFLEIKLKTCYLTKKHYALTEENNFRKIIALAPQATSRIMAEYNISFYLQCV
jgi:hypothetical protein